MYHKITHAQFLDAIRGRQVACLHQNSICRQDYRTIDDTFKAWRQNLGTIAPAYEYEPTYKTASIIDRRSFHLGFDVISIRTCTCYRGENGLLYILRRYPVIICGLQCYGLDCAVFLIKEE